MPLARLTALCDELGLAYEEIEDLGTGATILQVCLPLAAEDEAVPAPPSTSGVTLLPDFVGDCKRFWCIWRCSKARDRGIWCGATACSYVMRCMPASVWKTWPSPPARLNAPACVGRAPCRIAWILSDCRGIVACVVGEATSAKAMCEFKTAHARCPSAPD